MAAEKGFMNALAVGVLIGSPVWSLPSGLFVIVCLSIRSMLNDFNNRLTSSIKSCNNLNEGGLYLNIEHFRLKYQQLVELVKCVDGTFGFYVAITFAGVIAILCFDLYLIFYASVTTLNDLNKLTSIFRGVFGMTMMSILAISASTVNSSVRDVVRFFNCQL